MLRFFTVFFLLLTIGCSSGFHKKTQVFSYRDFGPQAMSYRLLGSEWWQWKSRADVSIVEYNVKVVVYDNISLKKVKKKYPVNQEINQDYRYVHAGDILAYLDKQIKDDILAGSTAKLKKTREKILERFERSKLTLEAESGEGTESF